MGSVYDKWNISVVMIRVAYYIIQFTKGAKKSHILGRRTDNTMKTKKKKTTNDGQNTMQKQKIEDLESTKTRDEVRYSKNICSFCATCGTGRVPVKRQESQSDIEAVLDRSKKYTFDLRGNN